MSSCYRSTLKLLLHICFLNVFLTAHFSFRNCRYEWGCEEVSGLTVKECERFLPSAVLLVQPSTHNHPPTFQASGYMVRMATGVSQQWTGVGWPFHSSWHADHLPPNSSGPGPSPPLSVPDPSAFLSPCFTFTVLKHTPSLLPCSLCTCWSLAWIFSESYLKKSYFFLTYFIVSTTKCYLAISSIIN